MEVGFPEERVYFLLMTNFTELTGSLRHDVEYIILGGRAVNEESLLKMANFCFSFRAIWVGKPGSVFPPRQFKC